MNHTTWILVSDASRARLFSGQKKNQPWTLLESIEHPESRARAQDLVTDRPGRVAQSMGNSQQGGQQKGSRSGMEPPTSPKEVAHEQFARFLSDMLSKGLRENAYSSLLIVANPHFLGLLRNTMDEQVKKHIKTTIDKDYTLLPNKELQERLADVWMYI